MYPKRGLLGNIFCQILRRKEAHQNLACAQEVDSFQEWLAHREEWAAEIHMFCGTSVKVRMLSLFGASAERREVSPVYCGFAKRGQDVSLSLADTA